jgi:DNA-binding transcriptional LysR family regulator
MDDKAAKAASGDTEKRSPNVETNGHSPDWDDLRIFGVVANARSLRKAARTLGIQQPTISRHIESLEASLGIKLLDRTPSGIRLTYDGQRIADEAQSIDMMVRKATVRSRSAETKIEGECKLFMSEGLATAWFIPFFLKAFYAKHPRLIVRLGASHETDRSAIPPFDMQIRYSPPTDSELKTARVGTFHFMYFASTEYIARHGAPESRDDFSRHHYADVTPSLTSYSGILATYSNTEALGRASLFTNSGLVVASAVQAGAVIGLLPSYAYLIAPNLVPVLPQHHYETGIYVNFAAGAGERSSVRAMIDFLRSTVFDKRRMPWFADCFAPPNESWRRTLSDLVAEAEAVPRR